MQSPDSMTFSTLNLGMMIEIILGPLASSLRDGTARRPVLLRQGLSFTPILLKQSIAA